MGIKESLEAAEQEFSTYIRWGKVVTLLAAQNQVTEKEVARWLLLQNAHKEFDVYHLESHIPRVSRHTDDKENKVEAILDAFIFKSSPPSYATALNNLLGISLHDKKNSNYGVQLIPLNLFLNQHGLSTLVIDNQTKRTSEQAEQPEAKLSKPQQREIALLKYLKGDDGYADILTLPTTAKMQAREHLTKNQPGLFTAATFDKAWASLSSRGDISIADKKKYRPN